MSSGFEILGSVNMDGRQNSSDSSSTLQMTLCCRLTRRSRLERSTSPSRLSAQTKCIEYRQAPNRFSRTLMACKYSRGSSKISLGLFRPCGRSEPGAFAFFDCLAWSAAAREYTLIQHCVIEILRQEDIESIIRPCRDSDMIQSCI